MVPGSIHDEGYLNLKNDDYMYFDMIKRIKEEKGGENLLETSKTLNSIS